MPPGRRGFAPVQGRILPRPGQGGLWPFLRDFGGLGGIFWSFVGQKLPFVGFVWLAGCMRVGSCLLAAKSGLPRPEGNR